MTARPDQQDSQKGLFPSSLRAASMSRSVQTMDPYWSRSQLNRHGSGHLGHREEEVVGRWKVGGA